MRRALMLLIVGMICLGIAVQAQDKPDPAEVVQDLQLQLIQLGADQEVLKLKSQELDEALKPENIEHSLAGIGSTKPEELREQRRKQLTAERTAVDAQLEQLVLQRSRLETNLATAQAQAYQQSAKGVHPVENYLGMGLSKSGLILAILMAGVVSIATLIGILLVIRRHVNKLAQRVSF